MQGTALNDVCYLFAHARGGGGGLFDWEILISVFNILCFDDIRHIILLYFATAETW